jgi:putative ABC transport system permease protein
MGGLWQDLQLAVRLLAKDRRFTIATVIALGLGIGVNTTVFSLINLAVFRDLPFEQPDRLVAVRAFDTRGNALGLSFPDFRDVRDQTTSFSGMSANIDGVTNISEEVRAPDRFRGTYLSAGTFRLLRSAPVLGRDFVPGDDEPGAPAVAILGYAVWQGRYGSDPSVIGRTIRINNVPTIIVGVMPAGFKYPHITEVWMPLSQWPGAANARRDMRQLGVTARLRDGVPLEQARADLHVVARRLAREYPATNTNIALDAKRLKDQRPSVPRPIITAMAGAVAVVLLIAYANLANLLLARSVTRAREIAVRISLGATRWRVIRQLLVECGVVAFLGSVLGFLIGLYGVKQLVTAFEVIEAGAAPGTTRPYWIIVTPDAMVYGFVALLCVISAPSPDRCCGCSCGARSCSSPSVSLLAWRAPSASGRSSPPSSARPTRAIRSRLQS